MPNLSLFFEKGKATVRRLPAQRLPRGWAEVRVRLSGICNTDLELLRGYYGFRGVPGHEFVGEVTATGNSPVEARWRGRRVNGEINIACAGLGLKPVCDMCRRDWPRHCRRRKVLGIVRHPGAHAERLWLPILNLREVPKNVSDEEAVFVEPLAAACEILEQVTVARSDRVAVLGDGKLGLLIAQVLASARPKEMLLIGRHGEKLALARGWGLQTQLANSRLPKRELDLVVDATGSPGGLTAAAAMLRPKGTLVMKSTVHDRAPIDTAGMVVDELTCVGSRCGPFERALEMLAKRQAQVEGLVQDCLPLAKAPEALRRAGRRGALKVLLRPGAE